MTRVEHEALTGTVLRQALRRERGEGDEGWEREGENGEGWDRGRGRGRPRTRGIIALVPD